jgi:hypothetical protein
MREGYETGSAKFPLTKGKTTLSHLLSINQLQAVQIAWQQVRQGVAVPAFPPWNHIQTGGNITNELITYVADCLATGASKGRLRPSPEWTGIVHNPVSDARVGVVRALLDMDVKAADSKSTMSATDDFGTTLTTGDEEEDCDDKEEAAENN